jgi:hypothetical protein
MATLPSDLSDVTGHNVFTNGQTLTHTLLNNAFGDLQTANNEAIDVLTETDKAVRRGKGMINNFGFSVAVDSPATGDILITFTQGDNATNCSSSAYASFNFWGTKEAIKLTAASTLKIDSTDDFDLDSRAANSEIYLYIYAINISGALAFGVGPRPDYRRATSDFTATEGGATDREKVFCTSAPSANDPCYVVGYFQATWNVTNNDWDSITSESDVVGAVPGPHPDMVAKAWGSFNGATSAEAIRAAENFVTIADGGTSGRYTLTLDTDMADTNYAIVATAHVDGLTTPGLVYVYDDPAAGSFVIQCLDDAGTLKNVDPLMVVCYGRQ